MRLDWSKEAIEEYLDTCLKKKKLTDYDYAIINFYDDYLDFHKMKGIYDKQFKDKSKILKKTTIKDILKEIENLVDDYRYLLQVLPKGVSEAFYTQIQELKNLYFYSTELDIKNPRITNQLLCDQSYQVFGSLSSELTKYLDIMYEKRLIKREAGAKKWYQDSCCNYDILNQLGFCYITNDQDSTIESVFNHELAHGITAITNSKVFSTFIYEFPSIYISLYTDMEMYKKTKNSDYLKSYYNYIVYFQKIIINFSILDTISKCGKITKNNIEDMLYKVLTYEITDFKQFSDYILSTNVNLDFVYLYGASCSLHLLEQDLDFAKQAYTNFCLNKYEGIRKFNKNIGINIKDVSYLSDVFNRNSCNIKEMVRKK